mmetsp:Transcript_70579/g.169103  ORF Transcript_70579/g.169103 Transcript_70579/m.169103 type:complete len:459 (+) Transcript_70579:97-1473(+)
MTPRTIRAVLWGGPTDQSSAARHSNAHRSPKIPHEGHTTRATMQLAWQVVQAAERKRAAVLSEQVQYTPIAAGSLQAKGISRNVRQRASTQPHKSARSYRVCPPPTTTTPTTYWPPTRSLAGQAQESGGPLGWHADTTTPAPEQGTSGTTPGINEPATQESAAATVKEQSTAAEVLAGLGCLSGRRLPAQWQPVRLNSESEPPREEVRASFQRRRSSSSSGTLGVQTCDSCASSPTAGKGVKEERSCMAAAELVASEVTLEAIASASTLSPTSSQGRPQSAGSTKAARPSSGKRSFQPTRASEATMRSPMAVFGLKGVSLAARGPGPPGTTTRGRAAGAAATSGASLIRRASSLPPHSQAAAGAASPAKRRVARSVVCASPTERASMPSGPSTANSGNSHPAAASSPSQASKKRNKAGNISKRFVLPFAYCVDDPRMAHVDSTEGRVLPEFLSSDAPA